jgi:hypothetical protein
MSEDTNVEVEDVQQEATVVIKISQQNLSYKSDFSETETIFWLEAVKSLIIKKSFEMSGLSETSK